MMMRLEPELTPGMVLPTRLPQGFALGDFLVEAWVRDGSMAAIYRAHRLTDGRNVAVKLQLPTTARDAIAGERFEREAEVLWRVRGSAHVVELLDVGMLDDGRRYLVLEWLDGEDLEGLLDLLRDQDHPLTVARACRIARDVAYGLAALHEHGVVHLDLEPAHMMVRAHEGADVVTLVDFGHAADLRGVGALSEVAPGEVIEGIPAYVAPERARGGAPSPACDIYALGVLLFETISGACLPPEGWSPETLPRVDALRHGVPPALAELVRLCMSRDVEQRPASARQVAGVLDAIVGALESDAGHASLLPAEGLRTGDTLVGMVVPMVGLRRPVPMTMPAPARTGRTQVTLAPMPFVRDEPPAQSGHTEISLLPPPSIDELRSRMQAEETETTMQLPPEPALPDDSDATMELEPQRAEPPVDPDATEVAMKLEPVLAEAPVDPDATEVAMKLEPVLAEAPVDPDATEVAMKLDPALAEAANPDDTAVTMVLDPANGDLQGLGAAAPTSAERSFEETPSEEREDAEQQRVPPSRSNLEWLVNEQPWWMRWAIAAGVVLMLGGTGTWLVQRTRGDEDVPRATTAVTASSMASAIGAQTSATAVPADPSRADERSTERARPRMAMAMETLAASQPSLPATPVRENAAPRGEENVGSTSSPEAPAAEAPAAEEAEAPVAEPAEAAAPETEAAETDARAKEAAANEAACAEVRARADAGKRSREWESVLKATRKRSCWSSAELRVERGRLRVTALAELGELERCVMEGSKSRDREIAARTALCRKKLDAIDPAAAAAAEDPKAAAVATEVSGS